MDHITGERIKFGCEIALVLIALGLLFALAIVGNLSLIELGLQGKLVNLSWHAAILVVTPVIILNWASWVVLRSLCKN